jgi:hypothetical protein
MFEMQREGIRERMNIDTIKAGDIVEFRISDNIYHGLVTSKGCKFPNPHNILYVNVLEHPEWKDAVVMPDQVLKVFVVAEMVNFS